MRKKLCDSSDVKDLSRRPSPRTAFLSPMCAMNENGLTIPERSGIRVSMKRLTSEERATILHLLCEGMSMRAVTRLTGASKNTVAKLLNDAGKACAAYDDANVRNVKAARVQV